jgi:Arc/MetJ-type ribon-helix-helix transcriptional regulator
MSERKTRLTVTIDPHLAAYAEQLVEAGKAPSVSAVVNDALEADRLPDQKARRLWKEAAERADPEKVLACGLTWTRSWPRCRLPTATVERGRWLPPGAARP